MTWNIITTDMNVNRSRTQEPEWVITAEILDQNSLHAANFSGYIKNSIEGTDYIKYNSFIYINKNSASLPNNFKKMINNGNYTCTKGLYPLTYLNSEFEINKKSLEFMSNYIDEVLTIRDKTFVRFNDFLESKNKNGVLYTLEKEDLSDCVKNKLINGYVQIAKNKYLTWY